MRLGRSLALPKTPFRNRPSARSRRTGAVPGQPVADVGILLLDIEDAIGGQIGPRLDRSRRPADLELIHPGGRAEAEPEPGVVCREIAGPAGQPPDDGPLTDPAGHARPDRRPARSRPAEAEPQPVAARSPVP